MKHMSDSFSPRREEDEDEDEELLGELLEERDEPALLWLRFQKRDW